MKFSQVISAIEDNESSGNSKSVQERSKFGEPVDPEPPKSKVPRGNEKNQPFKLPTNTQTERKRSYKRSLSSNLQSQRTSAQEGNIAEDQIQEGSEFIPVRPPTVFEVVNRSRPEDWLCCRLPSEFKGTSPEYVALSPRASPRSSNFNTPLISHPP